MIILVLRMTLTVADILRLPCKYEGEFVTESGSVLISTAIASFPDQDSDECRVSCLRNHHCESFNSKDSGNGCELNNKTNSDNEIQLTSREGWSYRGIIRNETLVRIPVIKQPTNISNAVSFGLLALMSLLRLY